jgi:hypothetical protein
MWRCFKCLRQSIAVEALATLVVQGPSFVGCMVELEAVQDVNQGNATYPNMWFGARKYAGKSAAAGDATYPKEAVCRGCGIARARGNTATLEDIANRLVCIRSTSLHQPEINALARPVASATAHGQKPEAAPASLAAEAQKLPMLPSSPAPREWRPLA